MNYNDLSKLMLLQYYQSLELLLSLSDEESDDEESLDPISSFYIKTFSFSILIFHSSYDYF